eukprot:scaffold103227_cov69-Phaeocystis_antarctica.AAC.4
MVAVVVPLGAAHGALEQPERLAVGAVERLLADAAWIDGRDTRRVFGALGAVLRFLGPAHDFQRVLAALVGAAPADIVAVATFVHIESQVARARVAGAGPGLATDAAAIVLIAHAFGAIMAIARASRIAGGRALVGATGVAEGAPARLPALRVATIVREAGVAAAGVPIILATRPLPRRALKRILRGLSGRVAEARLPARAAATLRHAAALGIAAVAHLAVVMIGPVRHASGARPRTVCFVPGVGTRLAAAVALLAQTRAACHARPALMPLTSELGAACAQGLINEARLPASGFAALGLWAIITAVACVGAVAHVRRRGALVALGLLCAPLPAVVLVVAGARRRHRRALVRPVGVARAGIARAGIVKVSPSRPPARSLTALGLRKFRRTVAIRAPPRLLTSGAVHGAARSRFAVSAPALAARAVVIAVPLHKRHNLAALVLVDDTRPVAIGTGIPRRTYGRLNIEG